jgi:CDP-diacylglycerol--glycerol-3-phosphate 3-phosphatidyltransferase
MKLTVPTILTLLRIALVPVLVVVLVVVFYLPFTWSNVACVVIFVLAAVTDIADGAIARRTGQMSRFGAFLDPVADKIMVTTALVLLVQRQETYQAIFAIAAAVIIGRENGCPKSANARW